MILNEQITMEDFLSGKESFRVFLYMVNKFELRFLKRSYLNTSDYFYFFYTDSIPNNSMLKDELQLKDSLKAGYLTLKKMKDRVLSFYFGIKENVLEYGFYDVSRRVVYKIGKFKITQSYFKKLPQHQCFKHIAERLKDADIKNMEILHQIKSDLYQFKEDGEVKILSEEKIKISFNKDIFEDLGENKLTDEFNEFKNDYNWDSETKPEVVIGEEKVHFYLNLIPQEENENETEFENPQEEMFESFFTSKIKNKFRSKDNPNVVAEELFQKLKNDINNNIWILTSYESEEDGHVSITLSNDVKLTVVLLEEDQEGLISLIKPKKVGRTKKSIAELPTQLVVDYSIAKMYIDYIRKKYNKNINKANKLKASKDVRELTKKL